MEKKRVMKSYKWRNISEKQRRCVIRHSIGNLSTETTRKHTRIYIAHTTTEAVWLLKLLSASIRQEKLIYYRSDTVPMSNVTISLQSTWVDRGQLSRAHLTQTQLEKLDLFPSTDKRNIIKPTAFGRLVHKVRLSRQTLYEATRLKRINDTVNVTGESTDSCVNIHTHTKAKQISALSIIITSHFQNTRMCSPWTRQHLLKATLKHKIQQR